MNYTMEQFLDMINLECHVYSGVGFESAHDLAVLLNTHYTQGGFLWFTYWKKVGLGHDYSSEEINETIRFLEQLPAGLSYHEKIEILQPLPEKASARTIRIEQKRYIYTVIVSEEYSRRIAIEYLDKNVIISKAFNQSTLAEANSFCQKIANEHSHILQPLFENGLQKSGVLSNKGFDEEYVCFLLSKVGMKDLSSEVQRLGLAISLANYGSSHLKNREFYYIKRGCNDTIIIQKSKREVKRTLSDW